MNAVLPKPASTNRGSCGQPLASVVTVIPADTPVTSVVFASPSSRKRQVFAAGESTVRAMPLAASAALMSVKTDAAVRPPEMLTRMIVALGSAVSAAEMVPGAPPVVGIRMTRRAVPFTV